MPETTPWLQRVLAGLTLMCSVPASSSLQVEALEYPDVGPLDGRPRIRDFILVHGTYLLLCGRVYCRTTQSKFTSHIWLVYVYLSNKTREQE